MNTLKQGILQRKIKDVPYRNATSIGNLNLIKNSNKNN